MLIGTEDGINYCHWRKRRQCNACLGRNCWRRRSRCIGDPRKLFARSTSWSILNHDPSTRDSPTARATKPSALQRHMRDSAVSFILNQNSSPIVSHTSLMRGSGSQFCFHQQLKNLVDVFHRCGGSDEVK